MTSMFPSRKNTRRTISGEVADHASTILAPGPDIEAEANTGRTPDAPPTEDVDILSPRNSEVESVINHRRLKETMRAPVFSKQEFNTLSSVDGYIRAARDGLAGVAHLFSKDMQVRVCVNLNPE